jgi:hypothetical protein
MPEQWKAEVGGRRYSRDFAGVSIYSEPSHQLVAEAYGRTLEEADRNAQVVVVAPELLFALTMVLSNSLLETNGHDWRTCDELSCRLARAAIARAEGREVPA